MVEFASHYLHDAVIPRRDPVAQWSLGPACWHSMPTSSALAHSPDPGFVLEESSTYFENGLIV